MEAKLTSLVCSAIIKEFDDYYSSRRMPDAWAKITDMCGVIADRLDHIENTIIDFAVERKSVDPLDAELTNLGHHVNKRGDGDRATARFIIYCQIERDGRKRWIKNYCSDRDDIEFWTSNYDCGGQYFNIRVFRIDGHDATSQFCKGMLVQQIKDVRRKKRVL